MKRTPRQILETAQFGRGDMLRRIADASPGNAAGCLAAIRLVKEATDCDDLRTLLPSEMRDALIGAIALAKNEENAARG